MVKNEKSENGRKKSRRTVLYRIQNTYIGLINVHSVLLKSLNSLTSVYKKRYEPIEN